VAVLGEVITRSTNTAVNTAAGGSGDLTKRWVDGSVAITPDGVNEVGDPHTFNVTVTAIPSGAGTPAFVITPAVAPAPDSMTSTCSTPVVSGNTATCVITINNDTHGVFDANVTADITVGGVTMRRSTDASVAGAGPGGSDGARKVYVDAAITVGLDGVNEVGDPHTVTGHVDVFDGSASAGSPAPAGTPITFTLVSGPGALSATSCATVGATGSCSVTLSSSAVGVTVVGAATSVDVQGVVLARSTDGQGANSGNLTKRWIDGFITITPERAENPLNEEHVFTVTVTAIPSGATPVTFGSITTSLSPRPGTVASTCDTPTVNGNTATCTLTINSAEAGTFVANATAQITAGGTTIVRSTDAAVAPAGPGGSGPATKVYVAPVTVLGSVVRRPAPAPAPLPTTGAEVLRMLVAGLGLVAVGGALVVTVRRRREAGLS
jgi:hypothetical protein